MTNAYYKAETKGEKAAITAQAQKLRDDKNNTKPVDTPLQIQSQQITQIVVKGTSKGYATESEWDKALKSVGIGTSTNTTHQDKMGTELLLQPTNM
ncbi:hypothetical protein [Paenibacillus sp. MMS20-IR301]|uniref:hypothetical protein n=1 Tax=Paenibacillus sp. MMS20-IR301 TaxID=2895946 RepID=UPI0028E4F4AD|nr:hypothetical protein [Paenibacillus sp. MMS20-IR301]WNS43300.1 hypothetical protein LOS79_30915 [Paenibacillus sp. MMS20-IR301]